MYGPLRCQTRFVISIVFGSEAIIADPNYESRKEHKELLLELMETLVRIR
jgi:hypothetical protein